MSATHSVAQNLALIRERMTAAAVRAGRSPDAITLMAVSKTVAPIRSCQRLMYRNARQPGGKLRSAGKLIQVLVRPDIGFLHDVFCLTVVAQNGAGHAI